MVPGRTVILRGNRKDMGGHRLTDSKRNLLLVAVEVPVPDEELQSYHSEKTTGRYEFDDIYANFQREDEDIRIEVLNES